MILELSNLTSEQEEMIYAIEDKYPSCITRDITASFDGSTVLQLFVESNSSDWSTIIASIINALGVIIAAEINVASKNKGVVGKHEVTRKAKVTYIGANGDRTEIRNKEDLEGLKHKK